MYNVQTNQTQTNTAQPTAFLEAPPSVSVPSIASGSSLVELSIGVWTGRKLDRTVSDEVASSKKAEANSANVIKKLLGDCPKLTAIQKFAANTRNTHYDMTMPWSDSGLRLLTTPMFYDYHNKMTGDKAEFDAMVEDFLQDYENEVLRAQVKLGDMFNPNEYPTVTSLRNKFKFNLSYIPMAETGDWRVDINNEAQSILKQSYERYYSDKLKAAMDDIWQRCYDVLARMSERLDYKDNDTKKVFRDSLVTNVLDMCDLLSKCNVTGDSQMEAMRQQLEGIFGGVTAEGLRMDEYLRKDTKTKVDAVLSNMSW